MNKLSTSKRETILTESSKGLLVIQVASYKLSVGKGTVNSPRPRPRLKSN